MLFRASRCLGADRSASAMLVPPPWTKYRVTGGERNGHAEAECTIPALLRIVAVLLARNIMASSRLIQARDRRFDLAALLAGLMVATASAQPPQRQAAPKGPWMDKALSPDQRAEMVVQLSTGTFFHSCPRRGLCEQKIPAGGPTRWPSGSRPASFRNAGINQRVGVSSAGRVSAKGEDSL